jgi:hypothetical protein
MLHPRPTSFPRTRGRLPKSVSHYECSFVSLLMNLKAGLASIGATNAGVGALRESRPALAASRYNDEGGRTRLASLGAATSLAAPPRCGSAVDVATANPPEELGAVALSARRAGGRLRVRIGTIRKTAAHCRLACRNSSND